MDNERMMVLSMLQEGKISVEEANALLEALAEAHGDAEGAPSEGEKAERKGNDARDDGTAHNRAEAEGDQTHEKRGPFSFGGFGSGQFGGGPEGLFGIKMPDLGETFRTVLDGVRSTIQNAAEFGENISEGFGFGPAHADETREFGGEVGAHGHIRISNKYGDVRVCGDDGTELKGSADIRAYGRDTDAARAVLQDILIVSEPEDDGWMVECKVEPYSRASVDLMITVPRGFAVSVTAASGDVRAEDIDGVLTAASLSGDVYATRIDVAGQVIADPNTDTATGAHQLGTKSGDLVVETIGGTVSCSSASGDMTIRGVTGGVTATTASGDVVITDGMGTVHASSVSGDVRVALRELGTEPITMNAVSGDVQLTVPLEQPLNVAAQTTSGSIRCSAHLDEVNEDYRHLNGRRGEEGVPIQLSTVSGDIAIREA